MNNEEKILKRINELDEKREQSFTNFSEKTDKRFCKIEEDVKFLKEDVKILKEDVAFNKKILIKLENTTNKMINLLTEREDGNHMKIKEHDLKFIELENKVEQNTLDILGLKLKINN